MSEWITHRRPTYDDAKLGYRHYVWVTGKDGIVLQMAYEIVGDRPWMPITPPEPYVKQKRYAVEATTDSKTSFSVKDMKRISNVSYFIPTREAAERIAAIYEEAKP